MKETSRCMQIPKDYSGCIISCRITWFLGFVQRLQVKKKQYVCLNTWLWTK